MKIHSALLGILIALASLFGTVFGVVSAQVSFAHDLFIQPASAQQSTGGSDKSDPREQLLNAGVGFGGAGGTSAEIPNDPRVIVANFIRIALTFVGMAMVLMIMYAGYLWWSAGGNDEKVSKAKATLRNAVIGLIIIAMSYGLVTFFLRAVLEAQMGTPNYFSPDYR